MQNIPNDIMINDTIYAYTRIRIYAAHDTNGAVIVA